MGFYSYISEWWIYLDMRSDLGVEKLVTSGQAVLDWVLFCLEWKHL